MRLRAVAVTVRNAKGRVVFKIGYSPDEYHVIIEIRPTDGAPGHGAPLYFDPTAGQLQAYEPSIPATVLWLGSPDRDLDHAPIGLTYEPSPLDQFADEIATAEECRDRVAALVREYRARVVQVLTADPPQQ